MECFKKGFKNHQKYCNPANAEAIRRNIEKQAKEEKNKDMSIPTTENPFPNAPVVATTGGGKVHTSDGEERTPIPVATSNAHVVSDGKEMSAKEKARLQAMAGTGRAANMRTFNGLKGEKKTFTNTDIDSVNIYISIPIFYDFL